MNPVELVNISVVGTGYVGLVVGACLAETGNNVVCADIDAKQDRWAQAERPADLRAGPRGARRAKSEARAGSRSPPTSRAAVASADVVFIAVGTPPDEDGSADLRHVLAVAEHDRHAHDARDWSSSPSRRCPVGTRGQGRRGGRQARASFRFTCAATPSSSRKARRSTTS